MNQKDFKKTINEILTKVYMMVSLKIMRWNMVQIVIIF